MQQTSEKSLKEDGADTITLGISGSTRENIVTGAVTNIPGATEESDNTKRNMATGAVPDTPGATAESINFSILGAAPGPPAHLQLGAFI